ncbi:MAG: AroM family protein [Dehalococcoidia bacterium]
MLGLVTIGQTPRPDFEAAFREYVPGVEFQIVGVLDGLSPDKISALESEQGEYPLHMLLADGSTADIQLDTLAPLVEDLMRALVGDGAVAVGLLCTGRFPRFEVGVPVLDPGSLLPAVAGAIAPSRHVGVVTPLESQVEIVKEIWEADGFSVTVAVDSPYHEGGIEAAAAVMAAARPEVVMLDCMGLGPAYRDEFARLCGVPAISAQTLLAKVAGELAGGLS